MYPDLRALMKFIIVVLRPIEKLNYHATMQPFNVKTFDPKSIEGLV